jgi:N-acetylglucosaminyldiphosphoundecaprenol N-acetyl-beta-D-mannosaminyltransferase
MGKFAAVAGKGQWPPPRILTSSDRPIAGEIERSDRREMGAGRTNRVEVLGVMVDPLALDEVLETVESFIQSGEKKTVHYANVYCVNLACKDREFRGILNRADLVYCDGYGVVLGAKIIGGMIPGRMTGADWIHDLCRFCGGKGYSIYLLGSRPGVSEQAARRLRATYPSLKIVGDHHGYLNSESEIRETIEDVNARRPDILLVGMGSPLQEKFIRRYREAVDVPVCWAVGALFDFVSGLVPRAPQWMLDHGLEWLFRLLHEPGRMWGRYLVGNTVFLIRVMAARVSRGMHPD